MESIIQDEKECWVCGRKGDLHRHHIFEGRNRQMSEKYGLTVWLCPEHHNMSGRGVHYNKDLDLRLKQEAQEVFEAKFSHQEYMNVIGRNYL